MRQATGVGSSGPYPPAPLDAPRARPQHRSGRRTEVMPVGDAHALEKAVRDEWWFRQASPRWDTIWRPVSGDLAAHRVLLLPARGFGMRGADLVTLWRARLSAAGLLSVKPDPAALHIAELAWASAIASPWSDRSGRSDAPVGRDR